jgi:hypothetical protein
MGLTIRKRLFETNSSSTHALVVSLEKDYKPTWNDVSSGWQEYNFEFGRETYRLLDGWDDKLAYIYIVLLEIAADPKVVAPAVDLEKFKARVNRIYAEVIASLPERGWSSSNEVPDHIFQVLEFLHDRASGKIPDTSEPKFDFNTNLFREALKHTWNAYVDHSEYFMIVEGEDRRYTPPCIGILEKLQDDDDYLKSFLFSDESYITIGGDEYRGYNLKTLGFEHDYRREEDWEKRVSEYEKTHDVYFKGN